MGGEVVGSVSERDLLDALFAGTAHLSDSVEHHVLAALRLLRGRAGRGAVRALESAGMRPSSSTTAAPRAAPLTRQDLLGYLAH